MHKIALTIVGLIAATFILAVVGVFTGPDSLAFPFTRLIFSVV